MTGLETLGMLALLTTICVAYLMIVAINQGHSQLLVPETLVLVFSIALLATIIAMIRQRRG
jgi:hypothetical protein